MKYYLINVQKAVWDCCPTLGNTIVFPQDVWRFWWTTHGERIACRQLGFSGYSSYSFVGTTPGYGG